MTYIEILDLNSTFLWKTANLVWSGLEDMCIANILMRAPKTQAKNFWIC